MADLRADGTRVQISGVRVSSPDVAGQAVPETSMRGLRPSTLIGVLGDLGLRPRQSFGLEVAPAPAAAARGRGAGGSTKPAGLPEPAHVLVEVPPASPDQGMVVLVEQGGVVSWVLPDRLPGATRSRAAAFTTFRIPIGPEPDAVLPGQRGLVGRLVRRAVHVLTFDLIDKAAGEVGDFFVSRWEAKQRPHRIRSFAPADYRAHDVPPLDALALRSLANGPALLLLHGTNSLSHSGFGALPPEEVAALHARYGGRVMAFDHPTLSVDPTANAQALADLLPPEIALEVDVLAHSRGGLVARVLAEMAETAGTAGRLRVRQVVFVATPNMGTPMADPERLGKLLDGLTNLLDLVPDNPVTDSLAGIVSVVRQLSVGALRGLDGLMAMNPNIARNPFLTTLNSPRPHETRYRAVAADYEPPPNSPRGRWVRDAAIDALFAWEPNDLIVPTASAYSWNGADKFPITERVVLPARLGVDHSTFWTSRESLDAFTTWLSADLPTAPAVRSMVAAVDVVRSDDVDPLSEVEERFAAGDIEGVRSAVRALPRVELEALQAEVGELALDSFVSRGPAEPRAGIVFVLPGIMGTNLWAEDGGEQDRIWLSPFRLVKGDFRRLRVTDGPGNIHAGGLFKTYLPLVMALDARWNVVPGGYDWRLPLEAAADALAARIEEHAAGRPMPAHLVGHSMGGLVARMLMARHPDVWRRIDNPDDRNKGGRLVMLGTPNLGSFAITLAMTGDDNLIRWLIRLTRGDSLDVLRIIGSFPGAYQLLTSPEVKIADSDHADLYRAEVWGDVPVVAEHLDAARATHSLLAASGLDADRMIYVAGDGHDTPSAIDVDPARPGHFAYRKTTAGDGRVTHQLGIPVTADGGGVFGDKVWYSDAQHGDLPKEGEVVRAVVDLLATGATTQLAKTPKAPVRGTVAETRFIPAELIEPPIDDVAILPARARSSLAGPATGSRAMLRAEARAEADRAIRSWLGAVAETPELPVLEVGVLHASLEYSTYSVMVGHYTGDPVAGAEGYLDRKLNGALTARQVADRYPERRNDVLRMPTEGRPPGALIVGLGIKGDLTAAALAGAIRSAALEHALAWLDDPCRTGDGNIGLSSCLIGSYGRSGVPLAAAVASIVEGVLLANVRLADCTRGRARITSLEFVERYAGTAEEGVHVLREVDSLLPGALRDVVDLRRNACLKQGPGRRPAVRTAEYAAGQWHRIVVTADKADNDGRVKLRFTSFGARARADQLEQFVDAGLVKEMLMQTVASTVVEPRTNTALFEMLFPSDLKRDLAGVDNIHLVVDDKGTADFPWEALTDRGGLSGGGPMALRGGFLRQLSTDQRRQLDPPTGSYGALVVGNPPGGPLFPSLEGARREAEDVAGLLAAADRFPVESLIFSGDEPAAESALRITSTLLSQDYRILHIAAHGHFEQRGDDERPFGGVVIGPGRYLTADSLRGMRRPPDLVFLNCCHLAAVGAVNIDDAAADGRAFTRRKLNELAASLSLELMAMGVRGVVVAGWAVADMPAAEFATALYGQMLAGVAFGEAVQVARNAAFAADGGTSNTWAAYQCYGDPAFRLADPTSGSSMPAPPVSADELQRTLEEIEVSARDASDSYKEQLSRQVVEHRDLAEREWPGKSRLWAAFGAAHATLGETVEAICAYRRALDRQDEMAAIKSVDELADLEHGLYCELTKTGTAKAAHLDAPATRTQLRRVAWQRLDSLDRLGRSASRHAMRARWYERQALLDPQRRAAELADAACEYVEAWRLSHDDEVRRDPCLAIAARQLLGLSADLPPGELAEVTEFLKRWRVTRPSGDFDSRVAAADLALAEALEDRSDLATVAAVYQEVFGQGSAPDERARVAARIDELAILVDPSRQAALRELSTALTNWRACC